MPKSLLAQQPSQQLLLFFEECALFLHQHRLLRQQFFGEPHQIAVTRKQADSLRYLLFAQPMSQERGAIQSQAAQGERANGR
ncbi:MAG TPA: hypothetical protein VJL59_07365 [Anaerolineales bacterium]|nr:hypothetical protein [Anaerolineales bacterium]